MKMNHRTKNGQRDFGLGLLLFFVVLILGLIVCFLGFDVVDASHEGVQVQLGKIIGIQSPGIQWTGLFTQVYSYDMRTRKEQVELTGSNSAVDKTGQAVYGTINVNYRVKPDRELVKRLYSEVGPDQVIADRLNLKAIILEGFKQATSRYDSLEIIEKRQEVKDLAKDNIEKNFPTDFFEIQDIVITNIDFSQGFKDAIEAKKVAQQTAIKEETNMKVVEYQMQQEITKYKAEAEKLKLQKNELNELLIKQQWIARWNGALPTYMITSPENANTMLVLPQGG